MAPDNYKLVVVRSDAVHYESTFGGWGAESTVYAQFRAIANDKRTVYAAVFEGREDSWALRSEHHNLETVR